MKNKAPALLIFDMCWFTSLFVLLALPYIFPSTIQHSLGFLAMSGLIGIAMIFSNRIKIFSLVGKMLYWTAINIFKPRSQYNHLIWGSFIFGFGIISTIFGNKPDKDEIEFFHDLSSSYEYWIGITAVLIFNILVGVYTARKYNKDKI
jgi:hypothetical protein